MKKQFFNNRQYRILFVFDHDRYFDEGKTYYPKYRKGFINPNKRLFSYEVRMYRTWKYNRKTKWKP